MVLEDTFSLERQKIQRQREELDMQEKQLTARIIRDDCENKILIGNLLEESVNRLFDEEAGLFNGVSDGADRILDVEETTANRLEGGQGK
jgi:hypothetical protein